MDGAFEWVSCIVLATHKHFFSHKLLLKMDPMTLFTHLKIILLQCFQFSILSKISGIQTQLLLFLLNKCAVFFEKKKVWF